MTKPKYWLSILALSVVLIAGSLAVGPVAIADDDDDDNGDDCDECTQERDEKLLEIIDEEIECMDEAGLDEEEIAECIAEADEDRDEAMAEWQECTADECTT